MILFMLVHAVNYEARLEDGTLVGKSDGVEFTVRDGKVHFDDVFKILRYFSLCVLQ